ncbi:hypothetical protein JXA48_01505 [Candidatus Woesearchaeota archaeon]|nr:hypothetical protein [Candidatus Woesearchaeota archaeon]
MNKSAKSTQVYLVGEFVLIGVLILMFGTVMGQSSNPLLVEKAVTAEDVARTMEIAQATAYDFRYEYPETLDGYTVKLNGDSISLVQDGEIPPETDFSFNKRYFTLREGVSIPKEQDVDVSDFYIIKSGDEIKLGDFKSTQAVDVLEVTSKEKPNVTVEFDTTGVNSFDLTLEKLSIIVKEEIKRNFETGDTNSLTVKISSHDGLVNDKNIIYYSTDGEEDTKAIAENMQKLLENELNLLTVPISKNYGQKEVIEFSLANSIENKKIFGEDTIRRKMGYLISYSLSKYYGVGR